ncbi:MAG: class I SAM-dependent methyltransferase [Planctomycetes bacterium]|nr:class I SAM-dependent methyltransferase [Planctomycetota bacterium]
MNHDLDPWDQAAAFDADYLHFYEPLLPAELNAREAELICELAALGPGRRVLDAGCGHGRIALELARLGCDVVGIDRSAVFVERARHDAAASGLGGLHFEVGDLRALEAEREFDAVVHWFTSFGYQDDPSDRALLARFLRALLPGGRLVLETANLFQEALDPSGTGVKRVDRDLMVDEKHFDAVTGHLHVHRTIARDGRAPRELDFRVRLFSVPELAGWLRDAGFEDVAAHDGTGAPFELDSDRLVLVAHRPRSAAADRTDAFPPAPGSALSDD